MFSTQIPSQNARKADAIRHPPASATAISSTNRTKFFAPFVEVA
jgi:hypothetical protein